MERIFKKLLVLFLVSFCDMGLGADTAKTTKENKERVYLGDPTKPKIRLKPVNYGELPAKESFKAPIVLEQPTTEGNKDDIPKNESDDDAEPDDDNEED